MSLSPYKVMFAVYIADQLQWTVVDTKLEVIEGRFLLSAARCSQLGPGAASPRVPENLSNVRTSM